MSEKEINYQQYCELGGIINESDYQAAMERIIPPVKIEQTLAGQARHIFGFCGLRVRENESQKIELISALYGILRSDMRPGADYHHGQMCDQRLFAEALRMLDYPELLEKVIRSYPNINFE